MSQVVVREGGGHVEVYVVERGQVAEDSEERFDVSALMFDDERPVYGAYRRLARVLAHALIALELRQSAAWLVEE